MTDFARAKENFRAKKIWKEFRKRLFKERKKDALTHQKLSGKWNVHHMRVARDIDEYADLDQHFECLNSQSHTILHFCASQQQRDPGFMDRLNELVNEMIEENEGRKIPQRR